MEAGYLMLIISVFLFIGGGGVFLCLHRCYKRRIQNVGIVAHPNQVKFLNSKLNKITAVFLRNFNNLKILFNLCVILADIYCIYHIFIRFSFPWRN